MPDPNPAPDASSAIPADGSWKQAFGADALPALESFKEPGEFFKSYQTLNSELGALKEKPQTFDWRKELAGDDESLVKTFERYSTAKDAGKAYKEAVAKIRSGELAKPLPKDATPEQITEWRKGNGIPEKPEGYFAQLPNGRVIGEQDAPLFNEVAAKLHTHNVPPAAMHELVEWYYSLEDKDSAALSQAEKQHEAEASKALREAWGNDFAANEGHLSNYISGLDEGLQKTFIEGFGGDGRKLMHNPAFKQWLSNIAREFNPVGFITPGGNETAMASLDQEIAKYQKMAGNQHSEYWKGPMAESHQANFLKLLQRKEALEKRAQ